jgi:hypothetical protein
MFDNKKTPVGGLFWVCALLGLLVFGGESRGHALDPDLSAASSVLLMQQAALNEIAESVEKFAAAVVPEPATLVLAVLGGSFLLGRRRHSPARVRARR